MTTAAPTHDLVIFFRFPVWQRVLIADHEPELVHDLPGGGPRLVQRARGIAWSFVNGRPVIEEGRMPDRPAGRGPGRALRAA